eukprot:512555_1
MGKLKRSICLMCFLVIISIWFGLFIFVQHILPQEEVDNTPLASAPKEIESVNKIPLPTNTIKPMKTIDLNNTHFIGWNSNIYLNFDSITSSISNNKDIHFDLSECTVCQKINNEYYIKNNSIIKTIDNISQLEIENTSFLITCSNNFDKSFDIQQPIGIPKIINMPSFLNNSFKGFCFIHSPGLQLDNTLINEKYLFRMNYHRYHYGSFRLLNGKKIKNIYPLNKTNNSINNIRNMVFISSFFGAVAFQHFIPGVIPRIAMIYDLIINQYKYEIIYLNNPNIILNITIITHLDIRTNSEKKQYQTIHDWFWNRFKKHFIDKYNNKIIINLLDVIDHYGWLKTTKYTYWSNM